MDIEKLIERLNRYFEGKDLKRGVALDAATALSALQAENKKLRAELEQVKRCIEIVENQRDQVKRERDAAIDCIYKIEDSRDRGNYNDGAREQILECESQKD